MIKNKIVLTGDRPSGKLHIGHYIGSLSSRLVLEKYNDQYIMIADMQALSDNFTCTKKVSDSIVEVALDYLAVGLDPNKTTIFIQSSIKSLSELTMILMNFVTLARIGRNPTVKTEIYQRYSECSVPISFFCYPISQAADIVGLQSDIVPVGDDQLPMIEQTNEIVEKFNRLYGGGVIKKVTPYLSSCSRLLGIDGLKKMSKSLNNAIYLSDSNIEIKKKVFSMFTDPSHIKITDPGRVEGNVVFEYLDVFYPDKEELLDLKRQYRRGGLGDVVLKNKLLNTLIDIIAPIREKRALFTKKQVLDILLSGQLKVEKIVSKTLYDVKSKMGILYF